MTTFNDSLQVQRDLVLEQLDTDQIIGVISTCAANGSLVASEARMVVVSPGSVRLTPPSSMRSSWIGALVVAARSKEWTVQEFHSLSALTLNARRGHWGWSREEVEELVARAWGFFRVPDYWIRDRQAAAERSQPMTDGDMAYVSAPPAKLCVQCSRPLREAWYLVDSATFCSMVCEALYMTEQGGHMRLGEDPRRHGR